MAGKSIGQRVSDIEARVGASSQRSFGEELVSDRSIFDRLTVDAANGMAQQANNASDQISNFGSRTETSHFNRARVTGEQHSASVYDYLRGKLRGVWIRALVITFLLWGVISAAVA